MGWHKWEDVRSIASPQTVETALREAEVLVAAIELNELRKARKLTQEQLAERLGIRQSNVSKLERRADLHVSTLRDVVEAMGGELRLTARFPDAEYELGVVRRAEDAAA